MKLCLQSTFPLFASWAQSCQKQVFWTWPSLRHLMQQARFDNHEHSNIHYSVIYKTNTCTVLYNSVCSYVLFISLYLQIKSDEVCWLELLIEIYGDLIQKHIQYITTAKGTFWDFCAKHKTISCLMSPLAS